MSMRAVIFDFDGVLVDSEPLHFRAMHDCLLPEGITISEDEYVSHYLAYDDRGAIRCALERHGAPSDPARLQALAERKGALFESLLPSIPFFPGVKELVMGLAKEVPLAIASGALRGEIEGVLRTSGLLELFGAVVGANDVMRTKPHPEPYLEAFARLAARGLAWDASDCLVVEDSPPGIAAGLAAGMKVLAVANSYPAQALGSAHRVVHSLEGLSPREMRTLFG